MTLLYFSKLNYNFKQARRKNYVINL